MAKKKKATKPPSRQKKATLPTPRVRAPRPGQVTERLPVTGPDGEPIRPSHWRYSRAKLALAERGVAPGVVAIAKELGIHRVVLNRFLRRYPWLDAWVEMQALEANVRLWGLIERRHGFLAIQGSTASAEVYAKMHRGVYARAGAPGDPDAPTDGRVVVNNTFLVPRPDYAGAAAAAAALPAATPALPSTIPTVKIR